MNQLIDPGRLRVPVFHVRLGGCCGCGDMVDMLLRGRERGRPRVTECGSPRHAGLLIISGPWNGGLAGAVAEVVEQSPDVAKILAVGDCALGRGPLLEAARSTETLTEHIMVDLEVAGCPVSLDDLGEAIRRALK